MPNLSRLKSQMLIIENQPNYAPADSANAPPLSFALGSLGSGVWGFSCPGCKQWVAFRLSVGFAWFRCGLGLVSVGCCRAGGVGVFALCGTAVWRAFPVRA